MAGARGETYLPVDGEQRMILFTNRALAMAEQATNKPITVLLQEASQNRLSVTDTAALLRIGLERARQEQRIAGRPITQAEADKVLDAVGFLATAQAVFLAINAVLTFAPDQEDEDSPPA